VYVSHGFSEHLGNYHSLGNALASAGFLAFGHDHAGHGKSEGMRACVESVDDFVTDVVDHCQVMVEKHGPRDLYIFGHSMGGMIAIRATIRFPNTFKGMVLVGPLVIPLGPVGPLDARLTPFRGWAVSWLLWMVDCLVSPELVLGYVRYEDISRDKDIIQLLKNDPLRWHSGTKVRLLRAFVSCLTAMMHQLDLVKVPFVSFHGDNDWLCNVEGSKLLFQQASTQDKRLVEIPNAAHNLLLETEDIRTQVLSDIVQWLVKRAPPL